VTRGKRLVEKLGRRRELLSLIREADPYSDAGARVHAATLALAYGSLPCAGGFPTMPAVILSSPSISDETRSIVVVDRTTLRMAVAI
jgi:hypothetical protein